MKIAAMAAGAVGGYFGARMQAAGHDVFFIARGAHLDADAQERPQDRERARRPASAQGQRHRRSGARSGRSTSCCSRSSCGTPKRPPSWRKPLVGPDTRVITLQNGVDSVERVAPILGADSTVGGAAYIATVIAAPGVIKHTSSFATMRFGRADKKPDASSQAFVDAGKAAKLDIALSDDIERERWQKFIFLTAMAGSTAGTALADRPDRRRSGTARRSSAHLMEEALRGRQGQRRRARRRLHRRAHEVPADQGRARHEGLDGARPRARQPARARLAQRQGARARPRARHADAGERRGLYRAQAAPHGQNGASRATTPVMHRPEAPSQEPRRRAGAPLREAAAERGKPNSRPGTRRCGRRPLAR